LVLSHIFGRRVCREVDDEEEAEMIKRSPSIVYLPSLPEDAADILRNHNRETLEIFTAYVRPLLPAYQGRRTVSASYEDSDGVPPAIPAKESRSMATPM